MVNCDKAGVRLQREITWITEDARQPRKLRFRRMLPCSANLDRKKSFGTESEALRLSINPCDSIKGARCMGSAHTLQGGWSLCGLFIRLTRCNSPHPPCRDR